jgi:hypothetical protein
LIGISPDLLIYTFGMDTTKILAEIDAEIQRLQHARTVLNGAAVKRGPGRPKGSTNGASSAAPKRRVMSAAGRARIAAAQKARWAKLKKAK